MSDNDCSPDTRKIVCHADGDRCLGCPHYHGKADVCDFAPPAPPQTPDATQVRARIKCIDELLHSKDCEAAHVELHELAHEFEALAAQSPVLPPSGVEALDDDRIVTWSQINVGPQRRRRPRPDVLKFAAQSPVLPPSGGPGLQPTPENIRYILQYGGRCRDCADRDGVCDNGMPCDPQQCEAVIKHTLAAISYGSTHGFYPPLSASVAGEPTYTEDQVRAAVEVTIQKMLDSGELIDNRALASPAQQKSLHDRACK